MYYTYNILNMDGESSKALSKNASSLKKVKSSLNMDDAKKGPSQYSFFFNAGDEMVSFKIPTVIYSVRDAIQQSVQILNKQYDMNLDNDYQKYELYAAKKTGKKKSDLPSLEYSQRLEKTKLDHFCIESKMPIATMKPKQEPPQQQQPISTETKMVIKEQPQEQYNHYKTNSIMKNQKREKQIRKSPEPGCFCFRK